MVRRVLFVFLFSRAPDSAEADSGPVSRQWLSPPPERPARVAAPGRARGRAWKLLANRGCDHAVHDCASWLDPVPAARLRLRSEEHTSELQSLMRISYAVFCLQKKKIITSHN